MDNARHRNTVLDPMEDSRKNIKSPLFCVIIWNFLEKLGLDLDDGLKEKLCTMILTFGLWGFSFKTVQFARFGNCDRTTYSLALAELGIEESFCKWQMSAFLHAFKKACENGIAPVVNVFYDDTIADKSQPNSDAEDWIKGGGIHYSHLEHKIVYGHQFLFILVSFGDYTMILDSYLYNNSGMLTPETRKIMDKALKEIDVDIHALNVLLRQSRDRKRELESGSECAGLNDRIALAAKELKDAKSAWDKAKARHKKNGRDKISIREEQEAHIKYKAAKMAKKELEDAKKALLAGECKTASDIQKKIASLKKKRNETRLEHTGKVKTKIGHLIEKFTEWQDIFREMSKVTEIYASGDSWFACEALLKVLKKCGITYIGAIKTNRLVDKNGKNTSISEIARGLSESQLELITLGEEAEQGGNAEQGGEKALPSLAALEGAFASLGLTVLESTVERAFEAYDEDDVGEGEEEFEEEAFDEEEEFGPDPEESKQGEDVADGKKDGGSKKGGSGKKERQYMVYRHEGRVKGIESAVVLLCWKKGKFHKAPPRAFICTDTSLTTKEILEIYAKRWRIETFFQTAKRLGLSRFEVRGEAKVEGCLRLLALVHTFCAIGLDKPMSLGEGQKWLDIRAQSLHVQGIECDAQKGLSHSVIWRKHRL
jgi:hypothetical protein